MENVLLGPKWEPQEKINQLVIFLHGYGANGNDLIDISNQWKDLLPNTAFISPDAPFLCEVNGMGRQWFGLESFDNDRLFAGAKTAAPILDQFIQQQIDHYKIKQEKIALVGFSQGAMMALHVGLRQDNMLGGIIGYSGALLGSAHLEQEIKSSPPILLVHGKLDSVVPYDSLTYAEKKLSALGLKVEILTCPFLAHGIDYEGIKKGGEFLRKIFFD
ncbi:MAG: dienelactone hydrolase family protein [Alphaproteobacteria bacterium]|nr:dienelactone hydrolase family protein [Alphaproteobacteria bacterium]